MLTKPPSHHILLQIALFQTYEALIKENGYFFNLQIIKI